MKLNDDFLIAGGSVLGREHKIVGKNNHDAYFWLMTNEALIGLIADGCGSRKHSEVGAKLGLRLLANEITRRLKSQKRSPPGIKAWTAFLEEIRQDVLAEMRTFAKSLGDNLIQIVEEYFLFTVLGTIITTEETVIFSLGDGIFVLNGDASQIGPFPLNEPPYLAYGLITAALKEMNPELLCFKVERLLPTAEVQSILLGTDGAADLSRIKDRKLPGKEKLMGGLEQFWQEERYFKNPDMIRRQLQAANNDCSTPNWEERRLDRENSLLPDDTTILVIRRQETEKE